MKKEHECVSWINKFHHFVQRTMPALKKWYPGEAFIQIVEKWQWGVRKTTPSWSWLILKLDFFPLFYSIDQILSIVSTVQNILMLNYFYCSKIENRPRVFD